CCLMGSSQAQNTYLGPDTGAALTGPNGSRVNIARTQFGVDGTGITLGQIEPAEPRRTHVSLVGGMPAAANVHGVGNTNIGPITHATGVAGIMIGRNFTFDPGTGTITNNGVATGANLFSTGISTGAGVTANQSFYGDLTWLLGNGPRIINMSA